MISTLQNLVLSLQNNSPTTPQSHQRVRKKRRPKTPDNDHSDSDSEPMEQEELHQLNAISTFQNTSMEQFSFIQQNIMEDSILEEEFPSWDDSSSESENDPNSTSILLDTQESDTLNGDLGNSSPGKDT
jgi:hypothetical protein